MANIYLTTPFMPVTFAALANPVKPYSEKNDRGETNKPEYKIEFLPTDEQATEWIKAVKEAVGNRDFKTKKPKFGVGIREADDQILIRAKSIWKPVVLDAQMNPIKAPKVGEGTIARAIVVLNIYDKGVSLALQKVQIKELVEYVNAGGFEAVDGYVAPEDERGTIEDTRSNKADIEETADNGASPLDL